jgi:hypothetical protein
MLIRSCYSTVERLWLGAAPLVIEAIDSPHIRPSRAAQQLSPRDPRWPRSIARFFNGPADGVDADLLVAGHS